MKIGEEKTFLNQATKWFRIQKTGMKVGMVSASALVVCGAIALVVAVGVKDNSGSVEVLPSSEIVSDTSVDSSASSELTSSDILSSEEEIVSSEETSSVTETASKETASKDTTSKDTTSSKPAESSEPTVSTIVAGASTSSETTSSASSEAAASTNKVSVDFSQALKVNKNVKGQLYMPGTKLNSWVVIGTDNSFYLNHGLDNKKSGWGVPVMDFRTTLTKDARSTNVVI